MRTTDWRTGSTRPGWAVCAEISPVELTDGWAVMFHERGPAFHYVKGAVVRRSIQTPRREIGLRIMKLCTQAIVF